VAVLELLVRTMAEHCCGTVCYVSVDGKTVRVNDCETAAAGI
jgi:hypothetical protein